MALSLGAAAARQCAASCTGRGIASPVGGIPALFPLLRQRYSTDPQGIFSQPGEDVGEVIESMLEHAPKQGEQGPPRVLTTRREAISLYREILRYSLLFVWTDQGGRPWRDVIRESARKEFEAARFETDPEMISRLLVVGRDCVQQAKDKLLAQRNAIIRQEEAAVRGGGPHRPPGM